MPGMPEKFTVVKLPLYISKPREVEVGGNIRTVQPFVERRRIFNIESQTFILSEGKSIGQVYLGLRVEGEEDILGAGDPNRPDPIQLYRAIQFLNRFDRFPLNQDPRIPLVANLHHDLADTYAAAGYSYPLTYHHYVTNLVRVFIGDQAFQEARQMVPENLMAVVENLRRQKVVIDGETLSREVNRGRIETNPLYEKVISETKRQRLQDKKFRQRFWRNPNFLTA